MVDNYYLSNKKPHRIAGKKQQGFTLVELMISLVLGLLISVAVVQVYIANVKAVTLQDAGSSIIDSNVFGIPVLEEHVRLANLGLADTINDTNQGAGVVLTQTGNLKDIKLTGNKDIPLTLLTNTGDVTPVGTDNEWTGMTATDTVSGQLTIQFRAPQNMFDCEGKLALGPREVNINEVKKIIDGQIVIERYYLNAQDATKPNQLSLYCDAGRYITEDMDDYDEQGQAKKPSTVLANKNIIKNFGDKGEVIVQNVDYFDILLGTKEGSDIQYYTTAEYAGLTDKPDIISIKTGGIIRSNNVVQTSELADSFVVLGNTVSLKADATAAEKKYLRFVFQNEIALRNARQKYS
ncbi:prepilin-type N-terminal cleavage/methylation domain-containing protein [Psychrobacter submarinus]|uniref:prepilin-type N-terminal cleavage/methylation domain-containing protein n=1 Tax=Psychrobacter submarinus TaxID=154108 RepID=UPI0019180DDF|nr:prepilin-type N-terminal cleavage/methylation domain-containing protein [Psychrobacter submarinus]